MTPSDSPAEAVEAGGLGLMHGLRIRVGEPGTEFVAADGEVFTLEKGSGVGNGRTLWLVQSDYDALKAAVPPTPVQEA